MFHQFVVLLASTVGQWGYPGIARAKELCLRIDVKEQNIHKRSVDIKKTKADTLPVVSLNNDYERLLGIRTLKNSVDLSGDLSTLAKGSGKPRNLMLKAAEEQNPWLKPFWSTRCGRLLQRLLQTNAGSSRIGLYC
jgi:hypothetical protein